MSELQGSGDTVHDDARTEVLELSERGAISQSDVAADGELRNIYRTLAKESLYFFTKAVLGYKDLTPAFHKPLAEFIQDYKGRPKTLDLLPRSTFKTTVGTIGFAPWYLLSNPNDFVLIANQTAANAERMLLEIALHFEGGNNMINWLFPEFVKPGDRWKPWNQEKLTFPARNLQRGTPSISTLGVGGKAESNHFHVIINDDLIGQKAMESETEMDGAISWHDYSVSLFVKVGDAIERVHGTRWRVGDLYDQLLEDKDYAVFEKKCLDSEGQPTIPELLPLDVIRKLRERNFAVFMSQYMNDPRNPEALDFKPGWLRRYKLVKTDKGPACEVDGEQFLVADMDVRLAVDPAGSGDSTRNLSKDLRKTRAKKANNAVVVWGVHGTGRYFMLDCWTGRGVNENPELQIAEKMLEIVMRWQGYLKRGYVEAYGAQRALITVFNMLCRDKQTAFPIEEIGKGNTKAKPVRIRSYLGPHAQNGQLHCRSIHDVFIDEFGSFPQSSTFDTLDASAWCVSMLKKPRGAFAEKIVKAAQDKQLAMRLRTANSTGY